ncbi:MAG: protein translocase subunit SecD, partial [Acidobacteriales bacterium]|nr:protein translocase subunit SecD [Terriglobales bacterium]
MQKNLLGKTIFIIVVLLIFLFGIFGIPKKLTGEGLKQAMLERIHLGLDLKGGTHLILQVQANEAVNTESDLVVERLKEGLRNARVNYGEIYKPDPVRQPERIEIKGIPPDGSTPLRTLITEGFPEFDFASGPEGSFVLTLKPPAVAKIKSDAVSQSIETIRNRIDKLGVTEPVIQEHGLGEHQILVQLPGVDDPARVKEIMQSTAMLEIRHAIDGQGYPS